MTEQEWLACTDPGPMLEFLRGKASDRKLRLFACACCRHIWQWLTDARSRKAIEVAEDFADNNPADFSLYDKVMQTWKAAGADWLPVVGDAMHFAVTYANWTASRHSTPDRQAIAVIHQAHILRDIFGPFPFGPVDLDHSWLTPTVISLAQAIYDERAFERMPSLADALEDAGCTNQQILEHGRGGREHVRACWVVDLLLGKR
jgi:hypothetical protein